MIHLSLLQLESSVYLAVLLQAARSAAAASLVAVLSTYELAYVSATVMSHASGLPLVHGMRVDPSGLLPSNRDRPTGSFTDGYCALFTALQRLFYERILRSFYRSPTTPLRTDIALFLPLSNDSFTDGYCALFTVLLIISFY